MPESIETHTDDGWLLRGGLHLPPGGAGAVRAAVVLGHAMMVDARTLDRPSGRGLASVLAEEGLAALVFDLRGHGRSGPSARQGARFSYDDFVRHDVPAIVQAARRRFEGLGIGLVGHSLAGHAAMIAAGAMPERAPDAIVGLGANLWLPRWEPSRPRRIGKGAALAAWAAVTAPRGYFEPRRFGVGNTPEPWPYVRQFLSMWRADRLLTSDGRHDWLEDLARARLPVLSIASEGDRVLGRPESVARFVGTMREAHVETRVMRSRDGMPAPDHMGLVLDPRAEPMWREVAAWLLARLDGRAVRAT